MDTEKIALEHAQELLSQFFFVNFAVQESISFHLATNAELSKYRTSLYLGKS